MKSFIKKTMPQFDFSNYSSQIFWLSLCFATLYFFMSRKILPRIRDILKERENLINSNLNLAKELDNKISEIQFQAEELRKNANQKYQSKLDETSKAAAVKREQMINDLKSKIEQNTEKSRKEIKDFIEKNRSNSENAIKDLIQMIKTKIFSK